MQPIIEQTSAGLYCPIGDFYIDPSRPVHRAVITHAHSDHARFGSQNYLSSVEGEHLLRLRVNADAEFMFVKYGEVVNRGGVKISLHPAGHILGSSQIRIEHRGQVTVITGDYKLEPDPTCSPWEPISCHHFITESTFGLPIFRWPSQATVQDSINHWWKTNQEEGRCSVLYGYAIGKSQRLLAGLDPSLGPILTHGAVEKGIQAYRDSGLALAPTRYVDQTLTKDLIPKSLVLAVPSAHGTSWLKRFGKISTAMASGWCMMRGWRRRRSMDQGFLISDHVDWPSLLKAVQLADAEMVWVDHGFSQVVARYLNDNGQPAKSIGRGSREENEDEQNINAILSTEAAS
ncbi:MAG: ligase-associated DNA damage response exonuclease [Rubripirellula sp.]|nr:ligase-associated DNA damage response exonuclease [Rubripirellula sp.]